MDKVSAFRKDTERVCSTLTVSCQRADEECTEGDLQRSVESDVRMY